MPSRSPLDHPVTGWEERGLGNAIGGAIDHLGILTVLAEIDIHRSMTRTIDTSGHARAGVRQGGGRDPGAVVPGDDFSLDVELRSSAPRWQNFRPWT
jgi:hypothetical protein